MTSSSVTSRRPARRLRRVARAGASVAVLATTLAGCGGTPAPLDALTEVQRTQLGAAWTARIIATDTANIAADERGVRAKALYGACKPLDPANPLLAAIAASCGPTASFQKLDALLPDRCGKPTAACVRALDRIAAATEQTAAALAKVDTEVKLVTKDPDCLKQLTTTELQSQGYGDLTQAYRVVALGVERKDKDIAGLGQRQIDDAKALVAPSGSVGQRTSAFRSACLPE